MLSSILMVLCHFICLLSFILTNRLVRSDHHLRNYWKLHGSTWNLLLLLFGTRFQTAFTMFPHSRLSNVNSRPTCFVKLFPTHSCSCFCVCFSHFSCLVLLSSFRFCGIWKLSLLLLLLFCGFKPHLHPIVLIESLNKILWPPCSSLRFTKWGPSWEGK